MKLSEKQTKALQSILREEFDNCSDNSDMEEVLDISESLFGECDFVEEMTSDFNFECDETNSFLKR